MSITVIYSYMIQHRCCFLKLRLKTGQMVSLFCIVENSATININFDRSEQRSALTTSLEQELHHVYSNQKRCILTLYI